LARRLFDGVPGADSSSAIFEAHHSPAKPGKSLHSDNVLFCEHQQYRLSNPN
jgi:hypothetical protein